MAIKKVYELAVDLKRTSVRVSVPVLVQGDSAEFRIRLADNGVVLSTEELNGITSVTMQSGFDAQTIIETVGTLEESVAVFRLQKGELFRSGTVQAMVQLADADDRISTLRFEYQVIPELSGNYIPGEQDITVFQRYMNDAQTRIEEMALVVEEVGATDVSQLTAQLAETEAEAKRKKEPEDLSDRTLQLVTGGGTVNVLSIPQKESVSLDKMNITEIVAQVSAGTWEIGTLVNGVNDPGDKRIRSTEKLLLRKGTVVKNLDNTKAKLGIHFYSYPTGVFTSSISFSQNIQEHKIAEDCYVRFVMAHINDTTITDISVLPAYLKAYDILPEVKQRFTSLEQSVADLEGNSLNFPINDTGKELLFAFNITRGASYFSDITFINGELYSFPVSNDAHTNVVWASYHTIDFETGTSTMNGSFTHNFGHCNSVDYREKTDALIMGNGGGSGNTQPDEIYIFENASDFKNRDSVDVSEAIKLALNVDGFDWGKQINVVWGESNGGKHNVALVISNDGITQFIHKILLGQGTNQFENGTFIEGKTGLQFNGTYKVMNEYTHPYSTHFANQGTDFYNGVLYEGFGHGGLSHFEKRLNSDGSITSRAMEERIYNDDGTEKTLVTNGLCIHDDMMFIGESEGATIYVYKL